MIDNEELNELYQALVLEHAKKPLNFGTLEDVQPTHGKNPSCGDTIDLYVRLKHNHIEDVKFQGEGCALCIASASLMTKLIKGKSIDEAQNTITNFSDILHGDKENMTNTSYEVLEVFKNVHNFPLRVKCAMLGWRALENRLEDKASS